MSRCPDIRFIFSHAGGTLPALTGRIVQLYAASKDFAQRLPEGPLPALAMNTGTQLTNPQPALIAACA